MKLYFVAGEASGDAHGAALMRALRELQPHVEFAGRGGPRMRELAGADFINWSDRSAVVGLWDVLKQYGYFRREFAATIAQIRSSTPDAVVLIDYPGFNLRLARELRRQFPRLKIIYYISPQVWAWNRRRIPKMARCLDLMLCIFPFEAELYNQSSLRTVFVGHPMMETLEARRLNIPRDPDLVALFPGSRRREIRHILPAMLDAAKCIHRELPQTRFEIAASTDPIGERVWSGVRTSGLPRDVVQVNVGVASEAMQRASVGMVASGTATLEAACFRLPFVLVYKMTWLSYVTAKAVVQVRHIGMPNLLAGREIVPEFIQENATPDSIADAVLHLLRNSEAREQMVREFDQVVATLGSGGASRAAAEAIVRELA